MSYVISKDMGTGNPPAFFGGMEGPAPYWRPLEEAITFTTEQDANDTMATSEEFAGCIVMPYGELQV